MENYNQHQHENYLDIDMEFICSVDYTPVTTDQLWGEGTISSSTISGTTTTGIW